LELDALVHDSSLLTSLGKAQPRIVSAVRVK
jgi:hypothetical protein